MTDDAARALALAGRMPAPYAAIAADLIAGRRGAAVRRIEALDAGEREALDGFLLPVWGLGSAPRPPRDPFASLESTGGSRYGASWLLRQYAQRWHAWRVVRASDRRAFGSAAVVNGRWLGDAYADRSFVLTNAHVCRRDAPGPGEPPAIAPDEAAIDWCSDEETWCDAAGRPAMARVLDAPWWSPPGELDATLLEVEPLPAQARPAGEPPDHVVSTADRCYLWGFPILDGEPHVISLSPDDNEIVEAGAQRFSYRAFAAPGSSGAPVFDQRTHELVGLHRGQRSGDSLRHAIYTEVILRRAREHLAKRA